MEPAASPLQASELPAADASSRGWHFAAPEYYTLAVIVSVALATYIFVTGDAQSERLLTPALVARLTRAAVSQLGSWKVSRERAMEGMPMMGPSVAAETVPE